MKAIVFYAVGLAAAVGYAVFVQTNYEAIWLLIMGMVAAVCLFRLRSAGKIAVVELTIAVVFGALGVIAFRLAGL